MTFLPQQCFHVAVATRLVGLLFKVSTPHPPLSFTTPTPPPQLITFYINLDRLKQHRFTSVWCELVLSCLMRSSPVVQYLETLWSTELMAYLFTELFDMHVCFYRFPSMLLCVGHTASHVTEETEHSSCFPFPFRSKLALA